MRLHAILVAVVLVSTGQGCSIETSGLMPAARFDAGENAAADATATPAMDGGTVIDPDSGAGDAGDAGSDASSCTPAIETCDGTDEDCDGVVDDGSGDCAATTMCTVAHLDGHAYLFCEDTMGWEAARDACMAWGYHLVTVDDEGEHEFVNGIADGLAAASEWWIGAYVGADGMLVWASGSSSYRNWVSGAASGSDCVMHDTDEGAWEGKGCGGSRRFVCEAEP